MIKIKGKDLAKGLSYVRGSVGTDATAKQETGLLYFEAISKDEVMFQIQGDIIISKLIIPASMESFVPIKALINYKVLDKYSKLSNKEDEFIFDFKDIEEDLLVVKLGTKLIGKIALVPLDAFELEVFDDTQEFASVNSTDLNELINLCTAFVDTKRDIRDYIQILCENNELILFTTDGDLVSTFRTKLKEDTPDFNITVKGSTLKKIKKFETEMVKLCSTNESYFLILKDGDVGMKAVIVHTDPPFTYHELQNPEEKEMYSKNVNEFSWNTIEMLKALQSVECSAKTNSLLFKIKDNSTLVLFTESTTQSSTRTEVLINSETDNSEIFNIAHYGHISDFRKISNLNKKEKVAAIQFVSFTEKNKPYLKELRCVGSLKNVNFQVVFGVIPYV